MKARVFVAEILQNEGSTATGIEVPFDPTEVFGSVRAPVRVGLGLHTYRTTVFRMSGRTFVPLSKENRVAAGVSGGDRVEVTIELDTEPRTVTPPLELEAELAGNDRLREAWDGLSYTAQKEQARELTEARHPETRARRLAKTLALLRQRSC